MCKYCTQNLIFSKIFFDKKNLVHIMRAYLFFYLLLSFMRRILSLALVGSLSLSVAVVSAQTPTAGTAITPNTPFNTGAVVAAPSTSVGSYQEVACTSDPIFGQNSCNQCFVGKKVKVGDRLSGLKDDWANSTPNKIIAYKNEQKIPQMISLDAKWVPASADEAKMWKSHSDIVWLPGTDEKGDSVILMPGERKTLIETDLGAGFTLESTTRKAGNIVGLLKFPVVYRTLDVTTGLASTEATTHYECVSYTLEATPEIPEKPIPKKPTPPGATKTKTGPAETLLLIVVAFFIAFGLMISLRKRS